MRKATKLRLSDGNTYLIFDEAALHLDQNGMLLCGDELVNSIIIERGLHITHLNDREIPITNVLTKNEQTNEIEMRDADVLLEDIGGASFHMDDNSETLSLKIGKWL